VNSREIHGKQPGNRWRFSKITSLRYIHSLLIFNYENDKMGHFSLRKNSQEICS
jgi:hypothetical protein